MRGDSPCGAIAAVRDSAANTDTGTSDGFPSTRSQPLSETKPEPGKKKPGAV